MAEFFVLAQQPSSSDVGSLMSAAGSRRERCAVMNESIVGSIVSAVQPPGRRPPVKQKRFYTLFHGRV
jgi:hypothetical protein